MYNSPHHLGIVYVIRKQYDKAIAILNSVIKIDPGYSMACGIRGIADYYEGKYEAALNDMAKANSLGSDDDVAFNNQGVVLVARQVWMFYLFAVVFGLAYGGMVPLTAIVPTELFGLRAFGAIYAGLTLVSTIGESLGAPVAGFIFDITGRYWPAFLICIFLSSLATTLGILLTIFSKKQVYRR